MKTLHGVTLPAFGELPEPAYTDNIGYVRDLADYAFPRFVEYGGGVTLVERLRNILDRDIDRVAGASTLPVFAHNDLHPNNILATERGGHLTLSGLIDFGNARASAGVMLLKTSGRASVIVRTAPTVSVRSVVGMCPNIPHFRGGASGVWGV